MGLRAKDIAEMLGVSPATVSIVLNNKNGVGEKRRQEIIQKIKELGCGYMLKEQTAYEGYIGFVVYKRDGSIVGESPFFPFILEGINNSISKHRYTLNFLYMNKNITPIELEQQIKSSNYKGLIVFGVEMLAEDLQIIKNTGIPYAILDNSFQESEVDSVAINNMQGTSQVLEHLYKMGHRRIGYIRSKVRINSFDERYSSFQAKMKFLEIPFYTQFVVDVGYSEEEAKKDIMAFLQNNKELPTAFFAENDLIACSAMRAIQEYGLSVPEDISIVGFDNRPISTLITPQLTTVNVPKDIFGPAVVDLLLSRINGERDASLKIMIGTDLVLRDSVKRLIEES